MMRQYELVERVMSYNPQANEDLLNKAYVYAMKAHGNQKRASGDPFFSHPLEVAAILTDLKLDDATIVTALLHDTIEDTEVTKTEIDTTFGAEIASLVDGLTKIKKLDLVTREAKQAENFRKLLIAITSDIRVLLVKLADRLHNMRTIEHMKPASRERISKETMEIYAPLAGRMGMQWLRDELEDLAFQALNPKAYENLTIQLDEMRQRNKEFIGTISDELKTNLKAAGLDAEVFGREKKPYSIWRKIERRKVAFEQLSDIFGFRIIAKNISECYQALGIIHTHWHMVPGRFKDYISNPKQNDYQSIHTTIVGPEHQRVELQIRTQHMHHIAEYGVAAHTLYKDQDDFGEDDNGEINISQKAMMLTQESKAYRWLRQLVDMLLEGDNSEEFLEHTKLELFQDQVFCFTPKGALVALPVGAVPIDFAYAVHTDIGNRCVGCKVNGHHVPLVSKLKNGDEVEIIISDAQTPPPAWEAIAVTGKARSAIRRATRDSIRKQYSELGRQILKRVFSEIEQDYSDELLEKAIPRLIQNTTIDILSAVGRGELSSRDVISAIFPDIHAKNFPRRRKVQRNEEGWFNFTKAIGLKFRNPNNNSYGAFNGIPIRGHQSDVPVNFAKGGAVPGDRIVGILTTGKGITIYPIHSSQLAEFDNQPERWIDLTWDIDESNMERFPAQINVTGINEPGTLASITQIIGEAGGNIDKLLIETRTDDFAEMLIDVEVWDLKHLNDIINGLRDINAVSKAARHYE